MGKMRNSNNNHHHLQHRVCDGGGSCRPGGRAHSTGKEEDEGGKVIPVYCTEYAHFGCLVFYNSQPCSYYILLPAFLLPQKSIVCENRQMVSLYE